MSVELSNDLKLKGNEAYLKKEYKKAAKIYRDAIKLNPSNAVLYSNRAICFIKLQDFERALKDCDSGISIINNSTTDNKAFVKLLYRKSLALSGLKSFDAAKLSLLEAKKLDPSNKLVNDELDSISKQQTPLVKKLKTLGDSHIISIDIQYVKELPVEFRPQQQQLKREKSPPLIEEVVVAEPETTQSAPTDLDLKSLSNLVHNGIPSQRNEAQIMLNNLVKIPFKTYQYVFDIESRSGISEEFLNFVLELIILLKPDSEIKEIIDYMEFLPTCRRFTLSKMFLNSQKLDKVLQILQIDLKLWR